VEQDRAQARVGSLHIAQHPIRTPGCEPGLHIGVDGQDAAHLCLRCIRRRVTHDLGCEAAVGQLRQHRADVMAKVVSDERQSHDVGIRRWATCVRAELKRCSLGE
jgi:hypothetical protein